MAKKLRCKTRIVIADTDNETQRRKEQTIWNKLYYGMDENEDAEEEWASGLVEIIPMPPDSSCLYHCFYECIKAFMATSPTGDATRIKYESYKTRLHTFIKSIDTEEYDVPEIENIDHTHILRFIVATNIFEDEFEEYKILCLGEPENMQYESLERFRTGVLFNNDFANQITIKILMRVFDGIFGVYIYCKPSIYNNGGLTTGGEWHNKAFNMFLELENNNHYNVIHFIGRSVLLRPRELQAVYGGVCVL